MVEKQIFDKLTTLADSAKYDVSCASSGHEQANTGKIGNSVRAGICHTWSSDGRCVSLLKTLLSNDCVYDCAYCVNRSSNDVARSSFTAEELVKLTIAFYRRNYIEGLFLSSAVEKDANHTMEKMVQVLRLLRNREGFAGYIHVKAIPGADQLLIHEAGLLADRMSVNIELPSEASLKLLAPQKPPKKLFLPMAQIREDINRSKEEKRRFYHAPKFVPAGQSTQMIVGATQDSDRRILMTSEKLYKTFKMKRVYYSAYMPVNDDRLLPAVQTAPPLLREHRLYQADFLLRFYKFTAQEILTEEESNFDLDYDPKIHWAFRHIEQFPKEINQVPYDQLLRVPGIGNISAGRIVKQRRLMKVRFEDLKKMGVVVKRAKYFITCDGKFHGLKSLDVGEIKGALNPQPPYTQLSLFDGGGMNGIPS